MPLHTRAYYYGLFAQDSWRVKPSLTLNYGLRWEVTSPWYEAQGQLETLVPGMQSKVFPGSPTGWVFPGDPGIPDSLAPVRHNNFAPRVGLAWSPSGKLFGGPGKTSIRASFGMFYTAFEDATGFNAVGDAPFGFWWSSPTAPLFLTPLHGPANRFRGETTFSSKVPFVQRLGQPYLEVLVGHVPLAVPMGVRHDMMAKSAFASEAIQGQLGGFGRTAL